MRNISDESLTARTFVEELKVVLSILRQIRSSIANEDAFIVFLSASKKSNDLSPPVNLLQLPLQLFGRSQQALNAHEFVRKVPPDVLRTIAGMVVGDDVPAQVFQKPRPEK